MACGPYVQLRLRLCDRSNLSPAGICHNPAFRAITGAVHSPRHCERSETIQDGGAELDCFVALLLAMTNSAMEPNLMIADIGAHLAAEHPIRPRGVGQND